MRELEERQGRYLPHSANERHSSFFFLGIFELLAHLRQQLRFCEHLHRNHDIAQTRSDVTTEAQRKRIPELG